MGVTRVETMETVQWVIIDPFEIVCGASNAVVIKRVCYIATHQKEKFNFNVY